MKTISIIRHHTPKTNIKCLMLLLVMVIGYGVHPAFAADGNSEFITSLSDLVSSFMDIAARAWIPLATLAGKFMSNDMIYGSRFHLDKYLWEMRNISKNFANFGILGFLLYEVIQSVTSKKANIQKMLGKTIVAGIAIQMSRFLVGAIVDVTTIATTAVGSFPASFLGNTQAGENMNNVIDSTVQKGSIILDDAWRAKLEVKQNTESTSSIKDKMMPKYDSVAGPLIFIGASALNIQDMMTLKQGEDTSGKSILVTFGLKGIILILYVITLLLLLIANVIRIGYLWVFIAISPIIILLAVFMKDKGLGEKGFAKNLTLKNFIAITFKPTIFVAVMGVILIFITTIQSVMLKDNPPEMNGIKINTNQATSETKVEVEGVASITTIDQVFSEAKGAGQSVIPNLIIYLATIFLLWFLVKISLSSGSDPISSVMKKGTEFIESSAKTTPLPGGLSYNKMLEMKGAGSKAVLNKRAESQFGEGVSYQGNGEFKSQEFEDRLDKFKGTVKGRSTTDMKNLETIADKGGDFLEQTRNTMTKNKNRIDGENYTKWKEHLEAWLDNKKTTNPFGKITKLDKFTEAEWQVLHEKLGGGTKKIPKNEEEFMKIDYSKVNK